MPEAQKSYTCRFPSEDSELIEHTAQVTDLDRAEILRRAFRNYVDHNPDQIPVFCDQSLDADREAVRESELLDDVADVVDALGVDEFLQLAAEEIDDFEAWLRHGKGYNRSSVGGAGVYDPTADIVDDGT